jgi:hypothetical protein
MKIKDNRNYNNSVKFGTLKCGTCFENENFDSIYMKIASIEKDKEHFLNAIQLKDGLPMFFNNNEDVFPLNAELIIED